MQNIYSEQLPIEMREALLIEKAKAAFRKTTSYASIIEKFATSVFPRLIKRIEALEKNQSDDLYPSLFLQAKREYLEAKAWIDLNFRVYKEVSKKTDFKEESEIAKLLIRQLQRIERYTQTTLDAAIRRFPKNYSAPLSKIEEQLDRILIGRPQNLAPYTREQKAIFFDKIKASKQMLREMAEWALQERPKWFQQLMNEGRGFYLSRPEKWAYSFIYTLHDNLYIPLESPEHFLGIGEGKIICRTLDLEKGKILALVKPRVLILSEKETEKAAAKRGELFDFAWRESNFLMKLRGKKGVIEVVERIVFKMDENQHLFLIEEKYEGSNLMNYVLGGRGGHKELDFKQKIAVTRCLLQGLVHIHEADILHRDIKPQNALIDLSAGSVNAVICDFNLACYTHETLKLGQHGFSPMGCSPEYARAILSTKREKIAKASTTKLDIWAMGTLLCFLFFNEMPPWMKKPDLPEILNFLANLSADWIPEAYIGHPLSSFILKLLSIDPEKRPIAIEAYEEFELLAAEL